MIFAGQFARVGKTLPSGRRLEIIELVAQGERNVEQLAGIAGLTAANASQHPQVSRRSGVVEARKRDHCLLPRAPLSDLSWGFPDRTAWGLQVESAPPERGSE